MLLSTWYYILQVAPNATKYPVFTTVVQLCGTLWHLVMTWKAGPEIQSHCMGKTAVLQGREFYILLVNGSKFGVKKVSVASDSPL
jgi:hypothetical protein